MITRLRFTHHGQTYAITGDSFFHQQEIALLRNSDLAVIDSGHISDQKIIELAVASQARQLICSHLYRDLDIPTLQHAATARGYTGEIVIGRDLLSFCL